MIISRKIFAFVCLFVAAVTVGWWLTHPSQSFKPPTQIVDAQKNTPPKQNTIQSVSFEPKAAIVQLYARTPYLGLADPRWKEYEAKNKADPAHEWKTPIEFYGKVIDEHDQPVEGATIEVSWNGTIEKYGRDGVVHRTLNSNSSGLFSLTGVEGKGVTVRVTKKGYHNRKTWNNGSFEYAGFWEPIFIEPDKNNPVVFQLVKRREAEPTYHLDGRIVIQSPTLETHLDLLNKPVQRDAPSDLQVRITRAPDANHEKPFDWKIIIEGTHGSELVESSEEFMTLAPNAGYKTRIEQDHKGLRSNQWQKMRFYVRNTARGFYAAVELEVALYYPFAGNKGAGLMIVATINPKNSPNLEYDPTKDIREMEKK